MNFKPNIYLEALRTIHPNAQNTEGKAGSIVAKDSNNDVIVLDETKINAEVDRIEAEWIAKEYQRARQYPSLGDQLDMQYWDQVNGTTTWKDAIAKVKADHPKP